MSRLRRLSKYVRENRRGILTDLAFAFVWVTIVNAFFEFTDGPQWAYYMFMLSGIVAYFLLFELTDAVDETESNDESA